MIDNWLTKPFAAHRCVYLCDWLPPDFGAVGQYSLQFSRERAARGEDVLLVGLSSSAESIEVETHGAGRLTIWRMKRSAYDKQRLLSRLWWTLTVNLMLLWRLFPAFRRADEIVFTGSPPFMVHWVSPLGVLLRRRTVYRITDFYPECLVAARGKSGLLLGALYRLTLFWRRQISVLEVIGEDQRVRLLEAGLCPERIQLKRDPSPVEIVVDTPPLAVPTALAGRIVLLYSGNFGVAHDVDTFVEGYIRHHREGTGRVALWLNAVGSGADVVEERLRAAGAPVVRSRPVPLEQLASLLVTPHAHLITLKNEFVGYVMPSKVYGCIESRKSVLYVGPEASDVHLLCSQAALQDGYYRADVGDVDGVVSALESLADAADFRSRASVDSGELSAAWS